MNLHTSSKGKKRVANSHESKSLLEPIINIDIFSPNSALNNLQLIPSFKILSFAKYKKATQFMVFNKQKSSNV